MDKKDYYEALGLDRNATPEQIKRAFRSMARKCHPDVNQENDSAEAEFKEINEAYQVLSDPEKKQIYDAYGHQGFEQGRGNGGGGFEDFGFGDIFDMFFGGAAGAQRGSSGPQRGDDLRYDLEMTLEEAFHGVSHKLKISRLETCDKCSGSGAEAGSSPTACVMCGGAGQVRQQQNTIFGAQMRVTTCPRCHGEGKIISSPCTKCQGQGRHRSTVEKTVDIPAGVDTGMKVRMPGEGDSGPRGGSKGDLYVVTHIRKHNFFQRKGNDLWCEMPISFPLAALGGEIDVPAIDGTTKLSLHPGTQPSDVFVLKGKGMPDVHGHAVGDLNVMVKVQTPKKLNDEQKELFQKLAASMGETIHEPENKSFFDQVKRMFD